MTRRFVAVYKGARKPEAYLFVDKARGLADVPAVLLSQFGETEVAMTLLLEPGRKLARANAAQVLAAIEAQGYFLQMPPTADELLSRDGSRG
ncbi:MAG: YcgL domain-containing protein [Halioglobus sp.]|nr:YcgL domain-containing protein [Halioglobus sp.]